MSIMLTVAPRDSRRRFDARGVGVAEDGEGSVGDCSRRCGVSHIDAEGCAEVVCDPTRRVEIGDKHSELAAS